jgi:hypothetical protein
MRFDLSDEEWALLESRRPTALQNLVRIQLRPNAIEESHMRLLHRNDEQRTG